MFLIISLSLTAFLAGYVMVRRGADTASSSKTGTILDKFGNPQQSATDNQQSATEEAGPVLLTEKRVVSVVNSSNKGSVMYFEKNTGKLYELDLETKKEQPVLDKVLPNFISAVWSPTKTAFVGTFVSGSETVFKYFNIYTGKDVSLGPNTRSVAFSPDGNLIVYHYLDKTSSPSLAGLSAQAGKIVLSEPDGNYQKKILDTRLESVELTWPTREIVSLQTTTSELYLLSEAGKLTNLLGSYLGLEKKWSPSGKKLLFSYLIQDPEQPDQKSPVLSLKNLDSREEKQLAETSATGCVWSRDDINVFCAVQKSLSVDEVYEISSIDGSKKLVAEPLMKIGGLLLSALEDRLLIMDASDEKLYTIKIAD